MQKNSFLPPRATLQHAHTRMLSRYMPWVEYMLTVTFGKSYNLSLEPTYEQAREQVRHLGQTLNSAIWGNRSKFDDKCRVLYIPVIEGAKDSKRIHAHILIGNVLTKENLDAHMRRYIPKSRWLLPRYAIADKNDGDGLAWYAAKETSRQNHDAIEWIIASIPEPLKP